MDEIKIDEILEEMWIGREAGSPIGDKLHCSGEKIREGDILEMQNLGYILKDKEGILFSEKGESRANQIIRGHRLAERLMSDVLALPPAAMENSACNFEHLIHHELADAICTLLGHPKECPHGRPIPAGDCCLQASSKLESVVIPFSSLLAGSRAKIVYITSTHYPRLDKLASLGIIPGSAVTMHQTIPCCIIQIGHTQVALDKEILKDIYVRRTS